MLTAARVETPEEEAIFSTMVCPSCPYTDDDVIEVLEWVEQIIGPEIKIRISLGGTNTERGVNAET